MTSPVLMVPDHTMSSLGSWLGSASRYIGTGRDAPRTSQDFSPAIWMITTS